ncbi:hypothetical protein LTR91_017138 [Friedmanniomyces endolithicus]|uniref:Uncharacterized protein n=1 Tax=Friedmanniomyces endolithicus TaxID=329885 RepID=A0AAN6K6N4_9PEZI|nr:hypothetical protein LTS00_014766 [Friedmanniomyces endolithicus]KAK0288174.1 hypothetical protein LTR35_003648 [Friedmanniomyces endolithicus]KAK0326305.1 hypothetical protein LTR82_003052 [Friedmanniomyces endolithicus]KAK0903613.1 hypothetical protein LTR57_019088 [Friedmanniomyces endolithicus]KAK0959000.1 hypothetical protein LTS01_021581 [Friedmanniomyces endolithicus]
MDSSPLRKLPPELRNCIYELTFTNPPIELTWTTDYDGVPRAEPHSNRRLGLALTATCKQIKAECGQGMFFANNDFIIFCPRGNSGPSRDDTGYADIIRRFIATIGFDNALAARTLSLNQARIHHRLFEPAIEQLYPLCRAIRLPLKIWLNRSGSLEIDMLQLLRTGDLVADRLDIRPMSRNQGPIPQGTLLREACRRALLEERRSRTRPPKWIFCRVCGESRPWRATTVPHMGDEGCVHITGAEMATSH